VCSFTGFKKGIFYSKFYYKFEYTYGITPLPQDLDYALYLIAIHLYNSFDKIKDGANKIQTPDGTIWYSSDFIPEPAKSILDKKLYLQSNMSTPTNTTVFNNHDNIRGNIYK
jgi:hypothetical protein